MKDEKRRQLREQGELRELNTEINTRHSPLHPSAFILHPLALLTFSFPKVELVADHYHQIQL